MASKKLPESTRAMNMRVLNKKIRTYESTIAFAQNTGLLPTALTCPCGSYVDKFKVEERTNGWKSAYFKCHQKKCKTKVNIRKKTLFENCKLKMHQIFILMYTFTQFLFNIIVAKTSYFRAGFVIWSCIDHEKSDLAVPPINVFYSQPDDLKHEYHF